MNESVHELMHLRRESRGHVIHLHGRPIEHHMEVMTKGNKSQIDLPYDLNDPPHQVGKYASTKTCVDMHPSHSTRQRFARVTCRVKTTGNNWKQLETTGNNWKQLDFLAEGEAWRCWLARCCLPARRSRERVGGPQATSSNCCHLDGVRMI